MNGEEVTLDGNDQQFIPKAHEGVKAMGQKGLPLRMTVLVLGAGGAQVGTEAIVAAHHLWVQNASVTMTIGSDGIHIKGTATQKAVISY